MDTDEYLVARVGAIKFGIYCRDVRNVYSQNIRPVRLFYQDKIYRGVTRINNVTMQVLDLRKRIGLEERAQERFLTVISFQTELEKTIAVIVDEVIGMKRISHEYTVSQSKNLVNAGQNISLLFPVIAVMPDGDMIYLLDSTYLDKTEPIEECAGDLELF